MYLFRFIWNIKKCLCRTLATFTIYLKKTGQLTQTKINSVTFKRKTRHKKSLLGRDLKSSYINQQLFQTLFLSSPEPGTWRVVSLRSAELGLSQARVERAFSPAAAEQIYPVFFPSNQEDFSQNASVACSCSTITRETEQSIKQRASKIQDLMPRMYFSLPHKPADTRQVLQHQWWLLGVETPPHHLLGSESIHPAQCSLLTLHLPPATPGTGISPTQTLWSSFIQPVPLFMVRKE